MKFSILMLKKIPVYCMGKSFRDEADTDHCLFNHDYRTAMIIKIFRVILYLKNGQKLNLNLFRLHFNVKMPRFASFRENSLYLDPPLIYH